MGARLQTGRDFEHRFGCCTALNVGERVFISGLTGDSEGPVDVQFKNIVEQAEQALGEFGASLGDIVRTGVYYTGRETRATLQAAHGPIFGSPGPAASLTQMDYLPSGADVMMEVEAMRGSASNRETVPLDTPETREMGCSGLVLVGEEFWLSGITAMQPDGSVPSAGYRSPQLVQVAFKVISLLNSIGSKATDVVGVRTYTPLNYLSSNNEPPPPSETRTILMEGRPGAAGITVTAVGDREIGVLVEVEGVRGAAQTRKNVWDGRTNLLRGSYSRSVGVGDVVYVSGSTSLIAGEVVRSPFDAWAQTIDTLETIRWSIEEQGQSWNDLVRTRSYVVGQENLEPVARALRETLGDIRPASTVVGVPALGQPKVLVEIEATAVMGAAG